MTDNRLRVSVVGDQSIAVDQLDNLPVPATLNIYVEKQEFREIMSIDAVASELGRSIRQVRRMISKGDFPEGVAACGQKQFWVRGVVREWQKSRLEGSEDYRKAPKGRLTRWRNEKSIEIEEDKKVARLHPDSKRLMNDVREMTSLLANDPDEFVRRHPNLKLWLKGKGLR